MDLDLHIDYSEPEVIEEPKDHIKKGRKRKEDFDEPPKKKIKTENNNETNNKQSAMKGMFTPKESLNFINKNDKINKKEQNKANGEDNGNKFNDKNKKVAQNRKYGENGEETSFNKKFDRRNTAATHNGENDKRDLGNKKSHNKFKEVEEIDNPSVHRAEFSSVIQNNSVNEIQRELVKAELFAGTTWESLGLPARLIRVLKDSCKYEKPTTIQSAAILNLKQRDALIKAETGSGKTLAYLIPLIMCLEKLQISREDGTYALIISPTRELALQIYEVLQKLLRAFNWLVPGYIIGGEKKTSEKKRLRKGITVLVATPGRLLDHLETTSSFNISPLRFLALDEADRLLDMGFEKSLRKIFHIIKERDDERLAIDPSKNWIRQNVLTSATLNKEVNSLALLSLNNPIELGIADEGDGQDDYQKHKIPKGLKQYVVQVSLKQRHVILVSWLKSILRVENTKVIVFFSNCDTVEFFHSLLSAVKLPTYYSQKNDAPEEPLFSVPLYKLHGSITQIERTETFFAFRNATSAVLFCTDVAARGLDMPNINWIAQYDPPSDPKAYIHRIGRTARIGQSGKALLFITPNERGYIDILVKKDMVFEEIKEQEINKELKTNLSNNPRKSSFTEVGGLIHRLQSMVTEDKELGLKELAMKAYRSTVRSYTTHKKSTIQIFNIKDLHLGHLAKSFCLMEPPKSFAKMMNIQKPKKKLKSNFQSKNEFESGIN